MDREPQPASGTADGWERTLLQPPVPTRRYQMSQIKSFGNDPKYHAKSLEQQLPSQLSEMTLKSLQVEGGPRTGGAAGGSWSGTVAGVPS